MDGNAAAEFDDITSRLVSETVACCPEQWNKGALSIQCDGMKVTYQLKNEGHPDKAIISEHLRDLIDELYVRMASRGHVWTEALVTWWREDSKCKFNISYTYPKTKSTPWWKFFGKRI